MSESVQAVMDQMVPALLDLTEKQLFSPAEISMLVNKRRGFEYLLQRVHARQSDFLLYIEFELNLLKLYNLRLAKTPKTKPSASDYHIEQHIHLIFVRAMRKYKSDIAMWLQYIDFCKKNNSSKKLGQIFAQALTYHPHNTTLYIESAGWEFFEQGNAKNARVVLQRALRTCNDAQELWLQYFIMELHYIQKMRGRREILQLKGKMGKKMEESEAFSGQVPLLVFQGAIKAVPQDVAFRLKFLAALDDFPQTERLTTAILESIEEDFAGDVTAWIARAAHSATPFDVLDSCLENVGHSQEGYLGVLEFLKKLAQAGEERAAVKYGKVVEEAMRRGVEGVTVLVVCAEFLTLTGRQSAASAFLEDKIEQSLEGAGKKGEEWGEVYCALAGVLSQGGDVKASVAVLESALKDLELDLSGSVMYLRISSTLLDLLIFLGAEEGQGRRRVEYLVAAAPMKVQGVLLVQWLKHCCCVGGKQGLEYVQEFAKRNVAGGDLTEFRDICGRLNGHC